MISKSFQSQNQESLMFDFGNLRRFQFTIRPGNPPIKSLLINIGLLLLILLAPAAIANGDDCFAAQSFPKFLQSTGEPQLNMAHTIATHDNINALFISGSFDSNFATGSQPDSQLDGTTLMAHIGRLQLGPNIWVWHKVMKDAKAPYAAFTVTALAVDPQGARMAAIASSKTSDGATSCYMFALDTSTGAQVTDLLAISIAASGGIDSIFQSGVLLQDDWTLLVAFNEATSSEMRLLSHDTYSNRINFLASSTGNFSHTISLCRSSKDGPLKNSFYLAGNMQHDEATDFRSLAIVKFEEATRIVEEYSFSILSFGCHSSSRRRLDQKTKPSRSLEESFIEARSNILMQHSSHNQLFGFVEGPSHETVLVWRVSTDTVSGEVKQEAHSQVIEAGSFDQAKKTLGMRQDMDLRGGFYWVHAIFKNEIGRSVYVRVSPDAGAEASIKKEIIQSGTLVTKSMYAVFNGFNLNDGNSDPQEFYQAYIVGQNHQSFTTKGLEPVGSNNMSYSVWTALQSEDTCDHRSMDTQELQLESAAFDTVLCARSVTKDGITFYDMMSQQSAYLAQDETSKLQIEDLPSQLLQTDYQCKPDRESVEVFDSSPSQIETALQCYNYGDPGHISFSPSFSTDPPACSTSIFWLYTASSTDTLPDALSIGVDSLTRAVRWYSSSHQVSRSQTAITYPIQVTGVLAGLEAPSPTPAFQFNLQINCCYEPTLIDAPETDRDNYTYTLGQQDDLKITLPGPWRGSNNDCCKIPPKLPVIAPADYQPGLFSVSADFMTVTVKWGRDGIATGPLTQTFSVSYSAEERDCTSRTEPVNYQVHVVNPCQSAQISIDPDNLVFKRAPEETMSQVEVGNAVELIWQQKPGGTVDIEDDSINYCGPIVYQFFDVTSHISGNGDPPGLDTAIFKFDDSTTKRLTVKAESEKQAQRFIISMRVYFKNFPSETASEREFIVNVLKQCTIIRPASFVTVYHYYIGEQDAINSQVDLNELGFKVNDSYCSQITFNISLLHDGQDQTMTQEQFDQTFGIRQDQGLIDVFTDDVNLLGKHSMHVQATLEDQPQTLSESFVLQFEFSCKVKPIGSWTLKDVIIPVQSSQEATTFTIGDPPEVVYQEEHNCQYSWAPVFDVLISQSEGNTVDVSQFVTYDSQSRTIICLAQTHDQDWLDEQISFLIDVSAQLSDRVTTTASTQFKVVFESRAGLCETQIPQLQSQEFKDLPDASLIVQSELSPDYWDSLAWDDSIVANQQWFCLPLVHEVVQISSDGTEAPYDDQVFRIDLQSGVKSIQVRESAKSANLDYRLRLKVYYRSFKEATIVSKDFLVSIHVIQQKQEENADNQTEEAHQTEDKSQTEVVIDHSADEKVFNQPPEFVTRPLNAYLIQMDGSRDEVIVLGTVIDFQLDEIAADFQCLDCQILNKNSNSSLFTFNLSDGTIMIGQGVNEGTYRIRLNLSDGKSSTEYQFQVSIKLIGFEEDISDKATELGQEEQEDEAQLELPIIEKTGEGEPTQIDLGDPPRYSLASMTRYGELTVQFSQTMSVPLDLSMINSSVIEIAVYSNKDDTEEGDEDQEYGLGDYRLRWRVSTFSSTKMTVQVDFDSPEEVSSRVEKDTLAMKIIDSQYFLSVESMQTISLNQTEVVDVPRMIVQSQLSEAMGQASQTVNDLSKVSLIGTSAINLFTSGSMASVWGMVHCLQIVSHYPLINLVFPTNVQETFKIVQQIAAFEVIPIDDLVEEVQQELGLKKDEFILSENFKEFELDSSDIVKNLQILFIAFLALMAIPFILLLAWILIFWSAGCRKILNSVAKALFFNIYIRFLLEAYLEVAIASLLRLRNFEMDTANAVITSCLSMVFLAILGLSLIGTFVTLLQNVKIVTSRAFQSRMGELTLGLRLNNRKALLYPSLFMLRRLIYAATLVYCLEWSELQIGSLMLNTLLFAAFIGHYRPYETPSANRIEFVNEVMIIASVYCLVIFQALVFEPRIKHETGWFLIALILAMMLFNLLIVLVSTCRSLVRHCKLRQKRKQNLALMNEKLAMQKLLRQLSASSHEGSKCRTLKERLEKKKQSVTQQQDSNEQFTYPSPLKNLPSMGRLIRVDELTPAQGSSLQKSFMPSSSLKLESYRSSLPMIQNYRQSLQQISYKPDKMDNNIQLSLTMKKNLSRNNTGRPNQVLPIDSGLNLTEESKAAAQETARSFCKAQDTVVAEGPETTRALIEDQKDHQYYQFAQESTPYDFNMESVRRSKDDDPSEYQYNQDIWHNTTTILNRRECTQTPGLRSETNLTPGQLTDGTQVKESQFKLTVELKNILTTRSHSEQQMQIMEQNKSNGKTTNGDRQKKLFGFMP